MEWSPSWEADSSSSGKEIHPILWSMKVHYCSYNSINPIHAQPIPLWWILWLSFHLCIDLPGVSFCQFSYINPVCISYLHHKCIWRHSSIESQQLLCTKQPLNFSMSCSQNHYVSLVSNKYGKLIPLGDVDFVLLFCRWFNNHSVLADISMPGVSNIQTVGLVHQFTLYGPVTDLIAFTKVAQCSDEICN
jgi:hypothetical protein